MTSNNYKKYLLLVPVIMLSLQGIGQEYKPFEESQPEKHYQEFEQNSIYEDNNANRNEVREEFRSQNIYSDPNSKSRDNVTNAPDDPNDVPIDGGLSLLLAAGAAYGVKKYKDSKKEESEESK